VSRVSGPIVPSADLPTPFLVPAVRLAGALPNDGRDPQPASPSCEHPAGPVPAPAVKGCR
jgi:hypothetical protein